jgi:excisionase family DNA binding protein
MPETLITLADAATRLGITERTAYEMARTDKLAGAIKVAGSWRVNPEKLEAWIDTNTVDADEVAGATGEAG